MAERCRWGPAYNQGVETVVRRIRLGHSPDSDDAFMFWGLAKGQVATDLEFEHILRDIQTLNDWAMEGRLESTAVSVHALAYVADRYAVLRHGGSFGEGYGPMVVARADVGHDQLPQVTIAVPGYLTSAWLQLRLYFRDAFGPDADPVSEVVPFDQIIPAILEGKYAAGLIIHEGQLTYSEQGLIERVNLGRWWREATGLPLPLGVNVVRKDLGPEVRAEVSRCMRESIEVGLKHRAQALAYALEFGRGMDEATSDEFVGMYVNERTLDMGSDGMSAIRLLLDRGAQAGLTPKAELEFVD